MGGSSKSSNSSAQNTTNINETYGLQDSQAIWGDVGTYDASTSNVTQDIYTDSSDRSILENSGQYAGMTIDGDFTVTDGGAFEVVQNTAYAALSGNQAVSETAILSGNNLARDLSAESSLLARESLQFGGQLVTDLFSTTRELNQQKDDFLNNAQKYAFQFADSASRSDGQQLALDTNKNFLYFSLAAAAVAVALVLRK